MTGKTVALIALLIGASTALAQDVVKDERVIMAMASLFTGAAALRLACDQKHPNTRRASLRAFNAFVDRHPDVVGFFGVNRVLLDKKDSLYYELIKDEKLTEEYCQTVPMLFQSITPELGAAMVREASK